MAKLFPYTIIILSTLASIMYFVKGDVRHGFYWLFAALLNFTVTI
jgi:hypothetical protein